MLDLWEMYLPPPPPTSKWGIFFVHFRIKVTLDYVRPLVNVHPHPHPQVGIFFILGSINIGLC